ncbi:MAG: hypothetical protein GF381_03435 [Candidatus Pacebacteria bacterium]|nr:hypothetical protein [Candidatus Paceibacterota bacterium]
MKKALHWLDNNILLILTGFLLAFIPLYPKLPLFEAIPGYIVRVRLEDLFVLATSFVWLIQAIRGKIRWQTPLVWLIGLYSLIGLLSIVSGVFLINTIPLEMIHLGKSLLHLFRYLEYFSLFVFSFSAIKSKKDVQFLMTVFGLTVIAAGIYGYGQKNWYWPVFSTMNREFSKGIVLYLTEHARVQSTFGGHYDLAAFLVIALNMMLALALKHQKKGKKIFYHLTHLIGLWLLVVSGSRSSFLSYLAGAIIIVVLLARDQSRRAWWAISRLVLVISLAGMMMSWAGGDMYERFLHVLKGYPRAHETYHSLNHQRKLAIRSALVTLGIKEPQKPDNGYGVSDLDQVLTPSDEQPRPDRPDDVYVDVPDKQRVATTSADGTTTYTTVEKERTWSENALKYGLSVAIRLDTLWPNAIKGFKRNPLLGSGYATLNKEAPHQFTEAESTDNNFLRVLGETGLLGFISFYGLIGICLYLAFKFYQVDRTFTTALSVGFIGATVGLLLNAAYIDVFAASKVAFTYWGLAGAVVGTYYLGQNKQKLKSNPLFSRLLKINQAIKSRFQK